MDKIEEVKGLGMKATDKEGNEYWAGSFKWQKNLQKMIITIVFNKEWTVDWDG